MSNAPFVTVGVPVYQGEAFVEETLHSIQKQTHKNIEVVISLDGPQATLEDLCQPFLKDSRFRMVTQPERLGWVGNLNWLMAQAETPYWYLNPQDDLVDPAYVETLLEYSRKLPEAAVVYGDIACFGRYEAKIAQPSVTGSAFLRQLELLHEHHAAVAFRGLTRVEALRHAGSIRANEVEGFSTDTTWMAAMARWGELQRVPVELYHKRYHAKNEHARWLTWPAEMIIKAWMIHCADMLEQAMQVEATTPQRRFLWLAGVGRLLSSRFGFLPSTDFAPAEPTARMDPFFEYVQTAGHMDLPTLLEERWDNIKRWTRGFYWHTGKTRTGLNIGHLLEVLLRKQNYH